MIRIDSIKESDTLTSPIEIQGMARGMWFFEAQFSVDLQDKNGDVIGTFIATANDEWMTEDFVPFTVTITYPPQTPGSPAKLVFHNANPSGEPENALEYGMWVTF